MYRANSFALFFSYPFWVMSPKKEKNYIVLNSFKVSLLLFMTPTIKFANFESATLATKTAAFREIHGHTHTTHAVLPVCIWKWASWRCTRGQVALSAAPELSLVLEMFTITQNAAQKVCSGLEAKEADKPGSAPFWGIRNAQGWREYPPAHLCRAFQTLDKADQSVWRRTSVSAF